VVMLDKRGMHFTLPANDKCGMLTSKVIITAVLFDMTNLALHLIKL
jgi:hypothetical protein